MRPHLASKLVGCFLVGKVPPAKLVGNNLVGKVPPEKLVGKVLKINVKFNGRGLNLP